MALLMFCRYSTKRYTVTGNAYVISSKGKFIMEYLKRQVSPETDIETDLDEDEDEDEIRDQLQRSEWSY